MKKIVMNLLLASSVVAQNDPYVRTLQKSYSSGPMELKWTDMTVKPIFRILNGGN